MRADTSVSQSGRAVFARLERARRSGPLTPLRLSRVFFAVFATVVSGLALAATALRPAERIQPWPENPSYWQYKGKPVLLVGGSDDDNLFQWPAEDLRKHLDQMQSIGANYVRNTMSDRNDKGFEIYPFLKLPNGKYDLEQWNPQYWERFERFLSWTAERDIIVQIELWDRFDFSRNHWPPHPFHPDNNVNFSFEESGFDAEYAEHPGRNRQPFFFTAPSQRNNTVVLKYQQQFIDKLLSYSLKFGHVLYCIDNETSGEAAWGRYWAERVKAKAAEQGVRAYVTEMWDAWNIQAEEHRQTFDRPELYDFVDVSQNNHNSGQKHADNALWIRQYVAARPRPINTVKTYGADGNTFGHTDRDGIERVLRHVVAGFASARFHRPPSGLGLNAKAQSVIQAVRRVEALVPLWDLSPQPELLSGREENEAYVAAKRADAYVVYFPQGGAVGLHAGPGRYDVHWIGLGTNGPGGAIEVGGAAPTALEAPGADHWLAVLLKRGPAQN